MKSVIAGLLLAAVSFAQYVPSVHNPGGGSGPASLTAIGGMLMANGVNAPPPSCPSANIPASTWPMTWVYRPTSTTLTVSDSKPYTWVQSSVFSPVAGHSTIYASVQGAGSSATGDVFSVSSSSPSGDMSMICWYLQNIPGGAAFDSALNVVGETSFCTSGCTTSSFTPTTPSNEILFVCAYASSETWTPGSGFTTLSADGGSAGSNSAPTTTGRGYCEYKLPPLTSGSQTAQFSISSNDAPYYIVFGLVL